MELEYFIDSLNKYFNIHLFSDFCINGLQVEGKKKIQKAATAVSANKSTIQQAIDAHIDVLIVHHGLFWKREEIVITGSLKEKIELLLKNQISLLTYHLPMDAHKETGNNWKAAIDLGWNSLQAFGPSHEIPLGVQGSFPKIDIHEFVSKLENYYGHSAHSALGGKKEISTAALVSGGAYKMVLNAAKMGLDCFITGNFDEPAWSYAHEEKIHFLALGHSATERVGPKALSAYIEGQYSIACPFLDVFNPF